MIEDYLIVVCGLGRCGTTAVMKMLYAAGIKVHCDYDKVGWSFESGDMLKLPDDHAWIDQMDPQTAFKLLDPHRASLPTTRDFRVIILTRDHRQQARSQLTLLKTCGQHVTTNARALQAHIRKEERRFLDAVRIYPKHVHTTFEMLVRNPAYVAEKIGGLLELDGDKVDRMARTIWDRSPDHSGYVQEASKLDHPLF